TTKLHGWRLPPLGACNAISRHSRMISGSTGREKSSRLRTERVVVSSSLRVSGNVGVGMGDSSIPGLTSFVSLLALYHPWLFPPHSLLPYAAGTLLRVNADSYQTVTPRRSAVNWAHHS